MAEDLFSINRNNYKRKAKPYQLRFSDVVPPIAALVRDPKELADTYKHLKLIPYSFLTDNYSADSLLKLLYNVAALSSSKQSCITSISEFAFGGKAEVVNVIDDSFKSEEENKVTQETTKKYKEFISSINFENKNILQLGESLLKDSLISGDKYLLVTISKVDEFNSVTIKHIDPKTVKYVNNGLLDTLAYSLRWDYAYLIKNNKYISYYPVYPSYVESGNLIQFIIHHKKGSGIYGTPESLDCIDDQLIEYYEKKYRLVKAKDCFLPDVLLEVEEDDPRASAYGDTARGEEDDNLQTKINKEYASGNSSPEGKAIAVVTRPFGSNPMLIHEFDIKTKEKYLSWSAEQSRSAIYASHNWSQLLSSVPIPKGWTSNPFADELRAKEPTIRKYQNEVEFIINTAFKAICKILNNGLEGLGINYTHPYKEMLNQGNPKNIKPNNNLPTDKTF